MEVVTLTQLPVTALFWQPRPNAWAASVVCKVTFSLLPGTAEVHRTQEEIEEDDRYWDNDPSKSVCSPCDLVPAKAAVDVVLIGHAFAHQPASSLVARLSVGTVDKSIEVVRNRAWAENGRLLAGRPWFARPLRYEHAGGGPGTDNPAGVAPNTRDGLGRLKLPHLQPPGLETPALGATFPPIGFGPIAPTWPARVARLGAHAGSFSWGDHRRRPLPPDFDVAYFNSAPADQQLRELPRDAEIVLEHLSQVHARLAIRLPGWGLCAFRREPGRAAVRVPMSADTLWIDTDRALMTVTWRAVVSIAHPVEVSRIVVATEMPGERLTWEEVARRAKQPGAISRRFDAESLKDRWGPLDFAFPLAAPDGASRETRREPATLPFTPLEALQAMAGRPREGGQSAPRAADEREFLPPEDIEEAPPSSTKALQRSAEAPPVAPSPLDTFILASGQLFPPALPFSPAPPGPVNAPVPLAQSVPPLAEPAPVAAYRAPLESFAEDRLLPYTPGLELVPPPAQVVPSVPVSAPEQRTPSAPAPIVGPSYTAIDSAARGESLGERLLRERTPASPAVLPVAQVAPLPPEVPVERSSARAGRRRMGAAPVPGEGSATAFSNAAADPGPQRTVPVKVPEVAVRDPSDVIELLWLDPGAAGRIRRDSALKKLLPKAKAGEAGGEDKADRARHEVATVLRRASPLDGAGLRDALRGAIEDGIFVPPLVVVGGELEMVFDEVETLKATLAAVSPFTGADPKLGEQVELVTGLLQTPWIQGASRVAEGHLQRLRDAFAETRRGLPSGYLAEHTEGTLLLQRKYQKRVMFGQEMVRALLHLQGDKAPLPAYLPEDAAKELPLLRRFEVRILAEGRRKVEEGADAAVKVMGCAVR